MERRVTVTLNRYRCDMCGCYLDPGEGRICDECQDELERKAAAARRAKRLYVEGANGQYEIGGLSSEQSVRVNGAV